MVISITHNILPIDLLWRWIALRDLFKEVVISVGIQMSVDKVVPCRVLSVAPSIDASSQDPALYIFPETFNIARVYVCLCIDRMVGVVSGFVNVSHVIKTLVGLPLIAVNTRLSI